MSKPEELLAFQLHAAKINFEREVQVIPGRKFRFDFHCSLVKNSQILSAVLVEVQGGLWLPKGGHTTGSGVSRDCEKLSLAAVEGYRVICVTPEHVRKGLALKWIIEALGLSK